MDFAFRRYRFKACHTSQQAANETVCLVKQIKTLALEQTGLPPVCSQMDPRLRGDDVLCYLPFRAFRGDFLFNAINSRWKPTEKGMHVIP